MDGNEPTVHARDSIVCKAIVGYQHEFANGDSLSDSTGKPYVYKQFIPLVAG